MFCFFGFFLASTSSNVRRLVHSPLHNSTSTPLADSCNESKDFHIVYSFHRSKSSAKEIFGWFAKEKNLGGIRLRKARQTKVQVNGAMVLRTEALCVLKVDIKWAK